MTLSSEPDSAIVAAGQGAPVARIYRPTRNAMQQGKRATRQWLLEFEMAARKAPEPLMGWTSSADTRGQVRLRFDSRDEAVAYAETHGLAYQVDEPKESTFRPKSYAANFAWNRVRS